MSRFSSLNIPKSLDRKPMVSNRLNRIPFKEHMASKGSDIFPAVSAHATKNKFCTESRDKFKNYSSIQYETEEINKVYSPFKQSMQ